MIGRENLHFAATKLNQHSSRSHCIFTIKVRLLEHVYVFCRVSCIIMSIFGTGDPSG